MNIENGYFDIIPEIEDLPLKYRNLDEEYISYRIFRWAIRYFYRKPNN